MLTIIGYGDITMSKGFNIRNDLYDRLKSMKGDKRSFSGVLDELLFQNMELQKPVDQELREVELREVVITKEGRFEGSKSLAGKSILYRVV